MSLKKSPVTFVATSDLCAITKGRAVLTEDLKAGGSTGWVPANLGIGPFGHIVAEGETMPTVPMLAAERPQKAKICRTKAAIEVLPLVPVMAATVSGWRP